MAKKKSEPQPEPEPSKKLRGGSDNIKERGWVQVLVHCTEEERKIIHRASGVLDQSTAQWGRHVLVQAAQQVLAEFSRTTKSS